MNIWNDQYKNAFESDDWKYILSFASKAIPEGINPELVSYFARFNKIVNFLDNLNIDYEWLPIRSLETLIGNISSCAETLKPIEENTKSIIGANKALDRIVLILWGATIPINSKRTTKNTTKLLSEYHDAISDALESIRNKEDEILGEINTVKTDIETKQDQIAKFSRYLFGENLESKRHDSEKENLSETIEKLFNQVNDQSDEIKKFHHELFHNGDQNIGLSQKIKDAGRKSEEIIEQINDNYSSSSKKLEELDHYHDIVFGVESYDPNKASIGLKQKIDDRIEELDKYKKDQEDVIEELKNRINNLLPDATSAGLATAYRECKEKAAKQVKRFSISFGLTVALLIVGGGIFGFTTEISTFDQWLLYLLYKSPFILPTLWLATFFSKRRSEQHRLEQEYAHKEALAKSYDSYKKQIDKLEQNDGQLLQQLMEVSIATIGKNPADTLDKAHGDSPPMAEGVNNIHGKS